MSPSDNLTPAEAVLRYPELKPLVDAKDAGWLFIPRRHADGDVLQLDGFYCWPENVTDAISVRSPTDAKGLRTEGAEHDIVWKRDGTLDEVVRQLLELPPPGTPGAPRLVLGRAPGLWTP